MAEQEASFIDLTRLQILLILYESPTHGYGIMSKFKERMGKDLSPGLVYPFLRKLEERGFVKQELVPIGQKQKKVFSLTEEGRKFSEHLFQRVSSIVSAAIDPTVEQCTSCGIQIVGAGHVEEIDGELRHFCCPHCANAYKKGLKTSKHSH